MRVTGQRTSIERLDVEVDPVSVLQKIYDDSIPAGFSYLSDDGYWYKEDFYDYHKREEHYVKAREATQEEKDMKAAYILFHKYIKEHKL